MSTHRAILTTLLVLLSAAACEKAPAPPAEAATAPIDTAPPAASATTPVAAPAPSAESPAASAAAPEETAAATAAPAPSAAPSSAPAEGPAHHGASHPAKEHVAEAPAAAPAPSGGAAGATPDDPCQTKKFHYAQVSSACHSGGRKAAKVVMKGVVSKAKAAGTDLKCTSCHEDLHDFQLKSNAVGDLKNWL